MKKLSIEEKAKAYDEAIRKAKIILGCCNSASIITKHTIYDIFPELAESEDEQIRKEIIKYLEQTVPHNHRDEVLKSKEWIAWLEKQGGQKPACSDDKKLTDVNHEYFSELLENSDSEDINDYAYQVAYCMSHDWIEETATWDDVQKACKLGAEWKEKHGSSKGWSEEDGCMLNTMEGWLDTLCEYLKDSGSEYIPDVKSCINWLKSLKQKIGG